MSKLIKGKNKNLKYSVLISIMLHIILITISTLYIKKNELNINQTSENDTMSIGLMTAVNSSLSQKSDRSSIPSTQEKLNNIKMLEKVPIISSQKSDRSSIPSTQEKLNNIKMLEKVPIISSQKSDRSSIPSTQEKQTSPYILKKTIQNNNNNKKITRTYEYDVNDLLNKLANRKHILKLNNDNTVRIQKKLTDDKNIIKEHSKVKNYEIDMYKEILIQSISEKFYDNLSYSGKQCILNANLLLDGTLKNIRSSDDYSPLCQAAISAVKLVKLPTPPNLEVYEIFKNITLNFSP